MTQFVAAVNLSSAAAAAPDLGNELARALTRHSGDQPDVYAAHGVALARNEPGVAPSSDLRNSVDGMLSLLCGAPLLGDSTAADVARDHAALDDAVNADRLDTLATAHGDFAYFAVDLNRRRVVLATDPLGLRPVYYTVVGDLLFVASALRILESLTPIVCRPDYRAIAQHAMLGHVIGSATPYRDISKLGAAEARTITAAGHQSRTYLVFDQIAEAPIEPQARSEELHRLFTAAVRRRRLGTEAVAHLSGGLDSRCVVAALRDAGSDVHTLNFAPAGSADRVLGQQVAAALGARHFEQHDGIPDFWQRSIDIHAAWQQQLAEAPRWPRRVWTGFGGELVLAPINITPAIAADLRAGKARRGLHAYLQREGALFPKRIVAPALRSEVGEAVADALSAEVARYRCSDPVRALHLFALLNEARGQLSQHHEDLDRRRIEFVLPFYDTAVVRFVLTQPVDDLMGHRLYHRWLQRFSPSVRSVAWQSYPGHEPCPLPLPQGIRLQWDDWFTRAERRRQRAAALKEFERDLRDPALPVAVLRRTPLRLAALLSRFGSDRYRYLFPIARTFVRFAGSGWRGDARG